MKIASTAKRIFDDQSKKTFATKSAHSVGGEGVEFTSAFLRAAEVHGRTASAAFDANDPTQKLSPKNAVVQKTWLYSVVTSSIRFTSTRSSWRRRSVLTNDPRAPAVLESCRSGKNSAVEAISIKLSHPVFP
jgi:hypothetical protein